MQATSHPTPDRPGAECAGPILFCRGVSGGRVRLAALYAGPRAGPAPALKDADGRSVRAQPLLTSRRHRLWRYRFDLPAVAATGYRFAGRSIPVFAAFEGDVRIGYTACNGMEAGDEDRALAERNALWRRLADDHARRPMVLLLHGGDQLYADEMLDQHPAVRRWGATDRPLDAEARWDGAARDALRDYLCERYVAMYAQPAIAHLLARVPSMMMWDDHNICDGWGSLPAARLDHPIGRGVFAVARECFLAFQRAAVAGDYDGEGHEDEPGWLGWSASFPGFRVVAPDLRSQRRPDRVMGATGWTAFERMLREDGDATRVFLLSSVPALGPRLSWVERTMALLPRAQRYEDDLRDQWQSRAHRAEWQRFLRALLRAHESGDRRLTVLSGEIHLATRGEMRAAGGPLHQLVASGIAHPPPPRAYARCLGALARLGESPLPGHAIRMRPLPGRRVRYTDQRNYLMLERRDGAWWTYWELETSGATKPLAL